MSPQLDSPELGSAESQEPPIPTIGRPRPEEPDVPVYRRFLTGEPTEYRLGSSLGVGLTAVTTAGMLGAAWLTGQAWSPVVAAAIALSAALVSTPLAILVSQWSGRRAGLLAGLLSSVGWTMLSCVTAQSTTLVAASIIAAIVAYGLAELPHRIPVLPRTAGGILFYACAAPACALAGPTALVPIAAVCLGTMLGNQNSRAVRFFLTPPGLAVLGADVALACFAPASASGLSLAWPQWPVAAFLAAGLAWICYALRTGHAASPFGRFLTSWLLASPALALLNLIPASLAVAIVLPAWAAVFGLVAIVAWRQCRRSFYFRKRRSVGSAR